MLKRLQRHVYSCVPELFDLKFPLEYWLRRRLNWPTEPDFHVLRRLAPRRGLALDLGANRGQSVEAIRMAWPSARIVAVEPVPHLAEWLRRRYPDVTVIGKAVADRVGAARLHVPQYRRKKWDALASLDEPNALTWLTAKNFALFDPRRVSLHPVEIEVTTVDALGLEPEFVKLDVQGHGHAAILGMRATLERCRPILLVEAPRPETVRFLGDMGYRHSAFEGGELRPGRLGSPNTFFFPCAA